MTTTAGVRSGVYALSGVTPRLAPDVFVAPGAVVAGDVEIGAGSGVWFNAVLRGDVAPIRVGVRTNVQDGAVLHVDPDAPCVVGDDVTIGHNAIVHGTTVGDGATIGMGAVVLSRSRIGPGAVVGAGALVPEGMEVGEGMLALGVPARERRPVSADEAARMAAGTARYVELAAERRRDLGLARGEEG